MICLLKTNRDIDQYMLAKIERTEAIIRHVSYCFRCIIVETNSPERLEVCNFIDIIEPDEKYDLQNIMIRTIPNIRLNKLIASNYMGSQSVVAVIDSGMDNIDGLVIFKEEVFSNSLGPYDSQVKIDGRPHGTAVGCIIKYLAPWGKLYNLKVMSDGGDIFKWSIVKALEYCYENNIKIINISLGKEKQCDSKCIVCNIVNQMADEGFVIVAAIGNYGNKGAGYTGCPGNSEKAFTVGAVDMAKQQLAGYSSRSAAGSKKPDILAPGHIEINSLSAVEGTSFASPVIAGIIASVSGQFDKFLIVDNIKKTAHNLGLTFNEQGHGLVHVENFLEVLRHEKRISQG